MQVIDGVIYKRDKDFLYKTAIDLVSQSEVSFKAGKNDAEIIFMVDCKQLRTAAQKTLHGNVAILALPAFNKKIIRDTSTEIFLHFKNKSICITKDDIANYKFIDECVWAEQIIPHELSENPTATAVFADFVYNIAGNHNDDAFRRTIGYALRNYNGSDGMRAIWLCDEDYETGKCNGRTGKSTFWKALAKVRKTDQCSGRDFTPEYQFKFQNMDRDTQIYVIDDVKDKFAFNDLYNTCTEGAEYQKNMPDA